MTDTDTIFEHLLSLSQIANHDNKYESKPEWLKVKQAHGDTLFSIKRNLRKSKLFTVCEEAKCPNIAECLNAGTATFMILGDICTRGCRFCNVKTGNPNGFLDPLEPEEIANNVKQMQLDYVVLTMVDRDDLIDSGAQHIAHTVKKIKEINTNIFIEVLTGDFKMNKDAINMVLESGINVFAHNLETVKRLSPHVRDIRASYQQSLNVLDYAKKHHNQIHTKTSLMLGLGENLHEITQSLQDIKEINTDIITLGQYLQPSPKHLKVERYAHPDEFAYWEKFARDIGFKAVASGPLVRSSYRAAHLFPKQKSS